MRSTRKPKTTHNLNKGHGSLERRTRGLALPVLDLLKDVLDRTWDDTLLFVENASDTRATHSVRLTRPRLAVCEHSRVVAPACSHELITF
jgi:hypothetical protein